MKRTTKLSLKKENVRVLSGSDLSGVAGGTLAVRAASYTCQAAVSGTNCNQVGNATGGCNSTILSVGAGGGGGG